MQACTKHGVSREAPLVSVIIPTHNRWPMVLEAVDSALGQEGGELEVIVVDDGSTDGTADQLEAARPGVTVVRETNRERGASRNTGLQHAGGAYVVFLDADDVLDPWYLRQFLEQWNSSEGSERIYVSDWQSWSPETGELRRVRIPATASDDLFKKVLRGTLWCVQSAVIPRKTAINVGGFPRGERSCRQRGLALVRLLATGAAVRFMPKPASRVREHLHRSTNNAPVFIASRQAGLRILLGTELSGRTLDEAERSIAIAGTYRFCAAHSYLVGDMAEARRYLRAMRQEVGLRVAALGWPACGCRLGWVRAYRRASDSYATGCAERLPGIHRKTKLSSG